MAKTGKRILAVVLLILTVLLVGCLVFTGNRLANYPEDLDGYKREIFEGKRVRNTQSPKITKYISGQHFGCRAMEQ